MKTLIFFIVVLFNIEVSAQHLNESGLYSGDDGNLFNGNITLLKDDIKSMLSIKDGKLNGQAIYYFSSGKIMETGNFLNGQKDGKWVRYNENGNLNAVAFYSMGKKSGSWLVYDNAGTKRFEMHYVEGEKTGVWTGWDENGNIVSTKDYSLRN